MAGRTITVDLNKRCKRCGKPGATDGGYCLRCVLKNLNEGKYDAIIKRSDNAGPFPPKEAARLHRWLGRYLAAAAEDERRYRAAKRRMGR